MRLQKLVYSVEKELPIPSQASQVPSVTLDITPGTELIPRNDNLHFERHMNSALSPTVGKKALVRLYHTGFPIHSFILNQSRVTSSLPAEQPFSQNLQIETILKR